MRLIKRILAFVFSIVIAASSIGVMTLGAETVFTENFDFKSGLYTETFANGRQFVTTVPNGGRTYDGVILNVPSDINASLTHDGRLVSFKSGEPIYDKGYYTLTLSASDVMTGDNVSGIFTFRIMGTPAHTAYSSMYKCPEASCINTITNNESMGMYMYTFPNYKNFFSTVPEYNAEVKNAVFLFPSNVGYGLTRNGKTISIHNNQMVTAPGEYALKVYAKNYGVKDNYEVVYQTELKFTIPGAREEVSIPVSSGILNVFKPENQQEEPVTVREAQVEATTVNNIISDNITESYNESANMYKEAFSNGDAFYTNTANGGISGGNVYIDIPANMSVEMTKDGLSADFKNKTYINEQGSYTLIITDSFGNKKYRGRYSFRIQKGIESSASVEENTEKEIPVDIDFSNLENEEVNSELSDLNTVFDEAKGMFVYTVGGELLYVNMPSGMFSSEGLIFEIPDTLNYSITKDGEDYEYNGKISEMGSYELFVNTLEGESITLGFELYDRAINFMEGYSVPKGYKIVSVEYEDYKDTYKFNEDNEDEENNENEEVSEEETEETTDSNEEAALEGLALINAEEEKALSNGLSYLSMPLDGRYTVTLEGNNLPRLTVDISVDRTAPVVEFEGLNDKMKSTGNEITVNCNDSDVKMTLFSKSGEETILSEEGGAVTFTGVGEYTLIAVDEAGNQSEYTFNMVRHIGAAGVGAIVLFIVLVAGLIAFIVYNSKKFSVR